METKNSYAKAAKKKSLLGSITKTLDTKGDHKNSAIETGKDLVAGVLGGGLIGAALGRASLAVGAVVTYIGHYTKSRLASVFGLGMMASGTQSKSGVDGTDDKNMLEGAQERVLAFKDGIQQKLFLDKVLKGKKKESGKKEEGKSDVGEVEYYDSTGEKLSEAIEKELLKSADSFSNSRLMSGMGELDPEERNY